MSANLSPLGIPSPNQIVGEADSEWTKAAAQLVAEIEAQKEPRKPREFKGLQAVITRQYHDIHPAIRNPAVRKNATSL